VFLDVLGIAKDLKEKIALMSSIKAFLKTLSKERLGKRLLFSRDEMVALARSISFLRDVRIRTKGMEKII